jgi:chemotaxis protein MotB
MRRGETVEVLSTDLHFKSGSADLSPEGVEKLKGVAERIKRKFPERNLRVEGFTDSRPIGERLVDRFPSNWELSAARAAAVVRHLRWTHGIAADRFEVVGFGPHQPVATNETAEGRRQNRRVRIAVLPPTEGGPARDAPNPTGTQRQ